MRRTRKSLIVALVVGLTVVGLAAWKFAKPSHAATPHLEQFLPAKTIAFIQVHDLRSEALQIADSEAWHEFVQVYPNAATLFMVSANHMGLLDASYAIALTGVNTTNGAPQPSFVMIGEFGSNYAIRQFQNLVFSPTLRNKNSSSTLSTQQHGETEVDVISGPNGPMFAYARQGNTLILSNSVDAVNEVIDVRAGTIPSMAANPQLQQALKRISYNDGLFGFLDGKAMTRLLDGLPIDQQKRAAAIRQLFHASGADSTQAVAMTSSFITGRVVERFAVVAPNGGHDLLHTIWSTAPTQQTLLNFAPASATGVIDSSIANAQSSFDEFLAVAGQIQAQDGKPGPDDALQMFLSKTGIDLRQDVIQSLGNEVCLVALTVGTEHHGALLLGLNNPAAIDQSLTKLAQLRNQPISSQTYQGVTIKTIANNEKHSGNFAFLSNGTLVASDSVAAVQQIIDTAASGNSLAATDAYRNAASQASGQPIFVFYGTNKDYLNGLAHTLSGQGGAFTPVNTTSNLTPSFGFGFATPDGFVVESHSPLGTFPRLLAIVTTQLGHNAKQN